MRECLVLSVQVRYEMLRSFRKVLYGLQIDYLRARRLYVGKRLREEF